MDIHKPKPAHSWREFLTEIGTIVIGVLIALAAEQVVEAMRLQHQMREAETAIASELTADLSVALTRMRMADCVDHRLDDLAKIVDQASRTGVLPPVPLIGKPRAGNFTSGGWNSVVGAQVATHFSPSALAALESQYNLVSKADRLEDDEIKAWSEIYTMVGPGRALDPRSADALRAAIITARTDNVSMAAMGRAMAQRINEARLPFTDAEKDTVQRVLKSPLGEIDHAHVCTAISREVPLNYGQTPWAYVLPQTDHALEGFRLGK